LGRPLRAIFPPDPAEELHAAISQTAQTGEPTTVRYELPLPQGVRFYEARFSLMAENRVVAIVRDVSLRKQAEQKSAALAALSQLLNPITTPQEAVRVIAAVAQQLIGWRQLTFLKPPAGNGSV
jgi:hypothetical protein